MIPLSHLQAWAWKTPWPDLRQVEQDLIISRALCDLFGNSMLKGRIAFRGGTAIHKLLFTKPLRYSEDIDLVQTVAEPIGGIIDAVRQTLSWLGKCNRDITGHSTHLVFQFNPEEGNGRPLKLKIEINTREHVHLLGLKDYNFQVENDWYSGKAQITSFYPEELFGTKLRALLQRNKNRDLFDLNEGIHQLNFNRAQTIHCFQHYLAQEGNVISRAIAEERMLKKLNQSLTEDIAPLLPPGIAYDSKKALTAFGTVWMELISRIPGEPWKSSKPIIEKIRKLKYPDFLRDFYF